MLVIAIIAFNSCKLSTSDLEDEVKELCNEKASGTGVRATDVNLVHENGNEHSGIITVSSNDKTLDFDINVVYDGEKFRYEIPALN